MCSVLKANVATITKKKLWVFVGKLPEVAEQAGNGHVPHVSNIRMSRLLALLSELLKIHRFAL